MKTLTPFFTLTGLVTDDELNRLVALDQEIKGLGGFSDAASPLRQRREAKKAGIAFSNEPTKERLEDLDKAAFFQDPACLHAATVRFKKLRAAAYSVARGIYVEQARPLLATIYGRAIAALEREFAIQVEREREWQAAWDETWGAAATYYGVSVSPPEAIRHAIRERLDAFVRMRDRIVSEDLGLKQPPEIGQYLRGVGVEIRDHHSPRVVEVAAAS